MFLPEHETSRLLRYFAIVNCQLSLLNSSWAAGSHCQMRSDQFRQQARRIALDTVVGGWYWKPSTGYCCIWTSSGVLFEWPGYPCSIKENLYSSCLDTVGSSWVWIWKNLNFLLVRNSSLSPRYGGKACRSCANQHGWPVPRCGDGFERWGWWCHRRGHYRCEWVPQQHVPQHEQGPSWWWQPHVKHPCMQAGLLWVLESWTMENRYTTSSSAMTNNMHTYEHASTLVLL